MGKVKAMYQDQMEDIERQISDLENDREKLKEVYVLLSGLTNAKIVRGEQLNTSIKLIDNIIKETDIAIDGFYAELDGNPLTTI
tara:strand:+ start:995 stop:1246 length:252 start_codon:yes stop_codon:yes gene_type:complete